MGSEASYEAALPKVTPRTRPAGQVRLQAAAVALACWSILALAWWMTPTRVGHGTHEQLGMAPCSLLIRTGYPCPTCGMTTSFAATVRGSLPAGLRAHPFGVVLVAVVAAAAVAATVQTLTGRKALKAFRPRWWWVAAGLAGTLLGWGLKVALGIADGTLPVG